jgi:hypothetical protein
MSLMTGNITAPSYVDMVSALFSLNLRHLIVVEISLHLFHYIRSTLAFRCVIIPAYADRDLQTPVRPKRLPTLGRCPIKG